MVLTENDKQRYLRHILLKEIGKEGQLKLKKAKVLVIGAGGLGCPVLQYLAAAGVGKIGIIDNDIVDISNLQRQVLFLEKNVGQPKVLAAKTRLQEMNSSIQIDTHNKRLGVENAEELFSQYDLIVEGSDNFTTKYLANDAAVLTGKPLVFGSIFKFEGQVTVFNYQNGPTYRCLFPDFGNPEDMPNCNEVGVLGILPGIIGSLQANEVIKIILGIGNVLSGKLFLLNALVMETQILPFSKNLEVVIDKLEESDFVCKTSNVKLLSYQEYRESQDKYTLVDVRTSAERAAVNIGGIHIPLSEINLRYLELDREDNFLVYCASGKRSAAAISMLQKILPQKNFYNLAGGLHKVS
jgi:adenylyltransferase/sulfurtransferase